MAERTEEQIKEEIASFMRKKDYYQILGVQKTASESEIKKAYRGLALRFHPDKNKVEGAKEVFKHVSHAYSILVDAQKREHYDRFGPDDERPHPRNRPPNPQEDYEFDQYDDIFRMFFGQMPVHHSRRGNFQTFSFGFGPQQQQRQQHAPQQQERKGFNMSYLFLIFLVVYTLIPLFKSAPSYSTLPSHDHKYKVKTSRLGTQFYVTQQFFEESKEQSFKRQAQMVIDRQFLLETEKKCQGRKREKKRMEEAAYRQSPGPGREAALAHAKNVDLGACRMIADLTLQHEDYIRDLTYMK